MEIDQNRPLKVLIVTTSFPVDSNPASGIFVRRLADSLCEKTEIGVLSPSPGKKSRIQFDYPIHFFRYAPYKYQILAHNPGGIPSAIQNSRLNILLFPTFIMSMFISIMIHGRKYDVIHANWSITGLITGVASAIIRRPMITTLRGTDVKNISASLVTRMICRMVLSLSERVVTVSGIIRAELVERWPKLSNKVTFIPNGVDKRLLDIGRKPSFGNQTKFITIGNLVENKDIATIIMAFSRLNSDTSLTIVGDGEQRSDLEKLAERTGASNRIKFTGVIAPADINIELSQNDVFILASHSEGRPNVVLEAMSSGCAVVSSDLPCITELIEHDKQGLLFPPGDMNALYDALNSLSSNPNKISKLGYSGRNQIKELGITWEDCAEAYIREYKSIKFTG